MFDVKGLVYGREYYPNGKIRFEGAYKINHGYGPNYPEYGRCYNEDGNMYYEGKLSVKRSGLGWPSVKMPKEFGSIPQSHPDLRYIDWSDLPCGKDDQQEKDDV